MQNSTSDDLKMVNNFDKFKPSESIADGQDEVQIEAHETEGIVKEMPMSESLIEDQQKKKAFYKKPWFLITSTILAILIGIGIWIAIVAKATYAHIQSTQTHATAMMTAFEGRDLATAKSELASTKNSLAQATSSYNAIGPLRYIPLLGSYLKDVDHALKAGSLGTEIGDMVILAIEPYADIMGFTGTTAADLQLATAEDRIIFVAETVEKLAPQMDQISAKLKEVSNEFQAINENRYPKSIAGKNIRENITTLKSTVEGAAESLGQFQPIVKLLPDLLGNPEPKKYLIMFQNDAELRPTGGFLTAYATMSILRGKITPGVSEDIYTLDAGFKKKVPAPDPIKKYLPLVYNWNLRDMNLSPDFKESMDTFTTHMQDSSVAPEFDALIAIDTEVPVRILKVLGPIGVPGYGGKFSAENDPRCDCPQVIYELENIITRPTYEIREGRKSILGPLMNSMLANMMGSPKAKWAEFFNIFTDSIKEKHLLMYFKDETKQSAVEALGAAGRINDYQGDYLHINDTNFAGAKSNMFVSQEVEEVVNVGSDGSLTKKLTLTYKNPRKGDNCNLEAGLLCLNGILRTWQRIYVPKGSVLTNASGYELDTATSEEFGKTVFEGFFTLSPQSVKKIEVEYTVPAGSIRGDEYKLLIQKQPGTKDIKHTITLDSNKPKTQVLDSDQEIIIAK
jgi:cytoskeletal protein RodZ